MTKGVKEVSTVEKILQKIPELNGQVDPIISDRRYIRKLSELAGSALQKNCDIMQLSNGDVVVSEVKTVFYTYKWDSHKGKFVRSKNIRKRRRPGEDSEDDELEEVDAAPMPAKPRGRKPSRPRVEEEEEFETAE
jgi:hypothetical protein